MAATVVRMWVATVVSILGAANAASAATVVIKNVHGYTPTPAGIQSFTALVIEDGRVARLVATGDAPPVPGAEVVDAGGKTLLPGLIDAHGHMIMFGEQRTQVELRGSTTLQDAVSRVRAYAAKNRSARWILGHNWNQVLWPEQRFPTAHDLDAVADSRPAMLARIDGHAVWVNSAALKIAGVTAATVDPPGGQIVRDASGKPTGVFIDKAVPLIEQHVPPATDEEVKETLREAMRQLAALGITGVHDAGIDEQQYRMYQALGASNELRIRIYAMLRDSTAARRVIQAGPRMPEYEDRLQMRAVKAWVDGTFGSRSAALLQDYSDEAGNRGLMRYTRDELQELARLTASKGWQLNVHAIGDAGNRVVLDTFETQLTQQQRHVLRPRIEHAQMLTLEDIPRLARLEVIASVQPTHATSDMNMAENRVGPERLEGAYAWRKFVDAGVRLAGGSDFPVELPDPFLGLYAAVTRQDREGHPTGGWYPREKLSREEALRLFTSGSAFAGHAEQTTGSLEPGKWADFILIDRDYFKVPESEIDDIRVLETYVAGKRVAGGK